MTKRDLMKELEHVERKAQDLVGSSNVPSTPVNTDNYYDYKFFVNGKLIEIKGDISNIILKKNSIEIIV